jgi:hypothetical protein
MSDETQSELSFELNAAESPRGGLFVLYDNEMEERFWLIRETNAVWVAPVDPQRFADTFGMRPRRAFHRS